MQWLQDPNHSNAYNQNNVKREDSRHFRNKKKEYVKAEIDELQNKIKIISYLHWGISDFKKGYQPRTNIVLDVKGDLLTDFHSISLSY